MTTRLDEVWKACSRGQSPVRHRARFRGVRSVTDANPSSHAQPELEDHLEVQVEAARELGQHMVRTDGEGRASDFTLPDHAF